MQGLKSFNTPFGMYSLISDIILIINFIEDWPGDENSHLNLIEDWTSMELKQEISKASQ